MELPLPEDNLDGIITTAEDVEVLPPKQLEEARWAFFGFASNFYSSLQFHKRNCAQNAQSAKEGFLKDAKDQFKITTHYLRNERELRAFNQVMICLLYFDFDSDEDLEDLEKFLLILESILKSAGS